MTARGAAAAWLVAASLPFGAFAQSVGGAAKTTAPPPPAASISEPAAPTPPPAPATPPATASAPGEVVPAAPSFVQPATGTLVEFDSDRPLVGVYVAPGIIADSTPRYPDPFVKIGRTPVATKLAPGTYTVTAESPDISVGTTTFQVGAAPVHVRVRSGSAGTRNLGTFLIAIGAASLLSAIAVEVSYSTAPNGISKSAIAIPLFIVGGVGAASGFAFYLSSGTTIEHDGPKPDRRSAVIGVTSRW